MEAMSPMGETIMDTSSMMGVQSPQSRLMLGLGEESMDAVAMSPRAAESEMPQEHDVSLQTAVAPVATQEGSTRLQNFNTSFTGSLSNVMLPGITSAVNTTSTLLLNTTSPTTVRAPLLFNQTNLTSASAGAPQFFVNTGAGVQPNATFLLNTSPGSGNMQTLILNPQVTAPGAPQNAALVVQNPVSNTAFVVNPGMLNANPNTLFLTSANLAASNGALMLAPNQGAPTAPQVNMMTQIKTTTDGTSEANVQPQTIDANTQLHQQMTPQNIGMLPSEMTQSVQGAVGGAEGPLLIQGQESPQAVEESSITEKMDVNKDMLALRLKLRRPREELVSQGIMPPLKTTPAFHEQRQRLERAKVGDSLQRKMRMRPDKAQLVHQHILEDTTMEPMVSATHQRLKRARIEQDLDCKIKNRPGPLELIEGNILKAEHLVEQAVKDGKVKFIKTSSLDPCDTSEFNFDEDSQEGCSDEALSPPQTYSQHSDNPPSSVGSVPSPPDFTFYDKQHTAPQTMITSSPNQRKTTATPHSITIKQEPGVSSPPATVSLSNTVSSSSSGKSSSSSSSSSSRNSRKKQTKRNKPKEIKFHEYKPPNEQTSKLAIPQNSSNPYNLLLMQQQLFLQLQLLQQQHQQLILPNAPNINTSKASSMNPGSQSPSSTTVTSSSSPAPQDKSSPSVTKTRILSNLEDMKVSELKIELKNRGLHVSGTKPQLVERLRPYADVSMSPVSTATSSSQDVTSSSGSSGGGTKVTSSTDVNQDSASETSSAKPSLSTPPVSPPEFKSPLSVTSEPSEPPSPGSAFDPMSPSTFHMVQPPSVSCATTVLPTSSPIATFCQSPDGQQTHTAILKHPSQLHTMQSLPMEVNENSNCAVGSEMMDVSAEFNYGNQHVSNEILRKQQQKIEELQRALRLSQLQLRQHQTQLTQGPPPPPPPPPPPQHPTSSPPPGTILRHPNLGQPPLTLSSISPPTSGIQPIQIKSQSPTKQTMSPVFQGKEFLQSLSQQPKVFSFATPPPNGQPFHFSKSNTDTKPAALTNGLVGQKSSSLPSSPTDPAMVTMSGGTLQRVGSFANPPPNYEEAVRQTKERKALGNLLNPGNTETGEPRMTKSQDLDDLLEVLVDHGYQIPVTPKNKEMINLSSTRLPQPMSMPNLSIHSGGTRPTQSSPSSATPQPPHHHQASPVSQTTLTSSSPPVELPMDVDGSELSLSSLDLGKSHSDLTKDQLGSSLADKDNGNTLPFDIPNMQVDSSDHETNFWSLGGDNSSPGGSGLCQPPSGDSDMNWLDLMIPSSGTGLTPVSVTPPTTLGAEGSLGTPLGKDPFPLNLFDLNDIHTTSDLHHLDGDTWDSIHVTE